MSDCDRADAISSSKKKICCVCKETKAARDLCILMNGEEQCKMFIQVHDQCLREQGFEVK